MAYILLTQDACSHDAKVRMAGFKNLYECTHCHKFIPISESKKIDHRAPQYVEDGWEDD